QQGWRQGSTIRRLVAVPEADSIPPATAAAQSAALEPGEKLEQDKPDQELSTDTLLETPPPNAQPGTPGAGDILAIRPGTDTVSVPLVATNFSEFTPALSPDGRWLAYSSNENGPREVYVVPFPNSGTAKWAVSTHGGTEPLWSHRGGELFYRDGAGFLVAVEVKTASTFSMGRSTALFPAAGFTSLPAHQQYAVSPDDRRFLMLRPLGASGGGKLVVVENWFEELKATARVPR
ncbi:MAG: TolB family protein, partial [Gemmatimonadales bacterium]